MPGGSRRAETGGTLGGGDGVRGQLLVRLVRVWWQMGEKKNDLGEGGGGCLWCPASDGQTRGGDGCSQWGLRLGPDSAQQRQNAPFSVPVSSPVACQHQGCKD